MRSMTYFVGILTGYLYMKLKEADYKLSLVKNLNNYYVPKININIIQKIINIQ